MSKKSIAASIYTALTAEGKTRKEIIGTIAEQAELSHGGASVYFNNFRKGAWQVAGVKAVEPAAIDLNKIAAVEQANA